MHSNIIECYTKLSFSPPASHVKGLAENDGDSLRHVSSTRHSLGEMLPSLPRAGSKYLSAAASCRNRKV